MFSREAGNFEGIEEICDIICLGSEKKFAFFPTLFWNSTNDKGSPLVVEIKELHDHFLKDGNAVNLGYQNAEVKLIAELKDQEKGIRLIDQGFQICVVLTYPRL